MAQKIFVSLPGPRSVIQWFFVDFSSCSVERNVIVSHTMMMAVCLITTTLTYYALMWLVHSRLLRDPNMPNETMFITKIKFYNFVFCTVFFKKVQDMN